MTGTDRIKAKILEEAKAASNQMLTEARAEAERVMADAQKQAAIIRVDAEKKADADADAMKKRMLAISQLEGRKEMLKARQEVVDMAYTKALEKLVTQDTAAYQKMMLDLVVQAAGNTGGELMLGEQDMKRLGDAFVVKVNQVLAGKSTITLCAAPIATTGGFVLRRGEMELNSTFDILLSQMRPKVETEVVAILFGSTAQGGVV